MFSVIARRDINVEASNKISAGKEIATIVSVLPVGTLMSLISQSHLVSVDQRESDIDPTSPYDLDVTELSERLSGEEATALLRVLLSRDDIDVPEFAADLDVDPSGVVDDSNKPKTGPAINVDLTLETRLDAILDPKGLKKDAAAFYAEVNVETVGELAEYLDIEGNTLSTPNGIGDATADKILEIPGLAELLGLRTS